MVALCPILYGFGEPAAGRPLADSVVLQSKSIGSLVSKLAILLVVIYFSLSAFHIPKNRIFVKVAAPLLLVPLTGCFRTS